MTIPGILGLAICRRLGRNIIVPSKERFERKLQLGTTNENVGQLYYYEWKVVVPDDLFGNLMNSVA